MHVTIDSGTVTDDEIRSLSLGQVTVLACFRTLGSIQQVANFLHRDEQAIAMVLLRIRKRGISHRNLWSSYEEGLKKQKARAAVNYAITKGTIKKCACEKCGENNAEAHHDNYDEPLKVRWLCKAHHEEFHTEKNKNRNE